jgi:hypothetical protein
MPCPPEGEAGSAADDRFHDGITDHVDRVPVSVVRSRPDVSSKTGRVSETGTRHHNRRSRNSALAAGPGSRCPGCSKVDQRCALANIVRNDSGTIRGHNLGNVARFIGKWD